jgi:hypothetical protein
MKIRPAVILLVLFLSAANLPAAMNVLIVGSTHSYCQGEKPGPGSCKPFNSAAVADNLREILARDPKHRKTAKVVFEEVYRTKTLPTAVGGRGNLMNFEYRCHSLAQYYFWPDKRAERLANLKSAGKTKWNYVVIIGDPYILANMPGVYAEGANLVASAAKEGGAKAILLMPPLEGAAAAVTARVAQVVYRVGKDAEIPVAPAGLARPAAVRRSRAPAPAARGEFLAAACVYSELFDRAAYSPKPQNRILAGLAFKTVKVNRTKKQFTGSFEFDNPFAMKYVTKTSITYNHTGTSSERGIEGALTAAIRRCKVSCKKVSPGKAGGAKVDFNYGRANSMFEPNKRYKVDARKFGRSYGFPMQEHSKTAAETMLYGIDKRYISGRRYDDGTDLGVAYDMIRQGEIASDIRAVPIRLMWAKLHDANPKLKPLRDRWHMSRCLDEATGTFMYTLLSGKRPVSDEPPEKGTDAYTRWLGRKIGYETAIRMSHLQSTLPAQMPRR